MEMIQSASAKGTQDLEDEFCHMLSRNTVLLDADRGFGYVNFVNGEDAGRAINKLSGFGYDSLILQVEWSPPRSLVDWLPSGNQGPIVPEPDQVASQASDLTAWSAWPLFKLHVFLPLFHL
ncbi:hypothetical protein VitviT2T_019671 [Vitis vinifera]|uniref:RRM domain-containing protein n=1 Tax=Vitis vinifera TaxID=29760 RepID=A0ABY9D1Z9_VITVI|nr:hypothetical protein VitviT2T_019671 [Vitis vinifera]